MATNPVSPSSDVSAFRRISDVVYRSLETALTLQCRQRHDTEVTVIRLDRTAADQPMRVQVGCDDQIQMAAQIHVSHVGGNVYDVRCTIEEGSSRRFTYGVPNRAGTALSRAPDLGRKLGTFLLNELERQIGRRHLRSH